MDKKKILLIIFAIIVGITFASFILYKRNGELGKIEIVSLGITALLVISISVYAIRKANNK